MAWVVKQLHIFLLELFDEWFELIFDADRHQDIVEIVEIELGYFFALHSIATFINIVVQLSQNADF